MILALAIECVIGKDGDALVILLGGGTKKHQQRDIDAAKACWKDYKDRKRETDEV
ncbi:MAG: hypothetical protein WBN77_00005 [Desulfobacterales bacterium]